MKENNWQEEILKWPQWVAKEYLTFISEILNKTICKLILRYKNVQNI